MAADEEPFTNLVEPTGQAEPGPPPEQGAQWDEVHGRWERWDEAAEQWVVIGEPGDGVAPAEEINLPASLAAGLLRAQELEATDEPPVEDIDRKPEPPEQVEGAQWNEVVGRWERWDAAANAWVAVE